MKNHRNEKNVSNNKERTIGRENSDKFANNQVYLLQYCAEFRNFEKQSKSHQRKEDFEVIKNMSQSKDTNIGNDNKNCAHQSKL